MGEFVKQDSVEFSLIEQPIDADRKQDIWLKDAADCGSSMPDVEGYGDASRYETRDHALVAQTGRGLRLALSAYTRDQSQKHRQRPSDPYDGKHHRRPALRYVPYGAANGAKRCGPSQMRRPELIHHRARRHNEIERRHHPDPILRGGAGPADSREKPRSTADNRCIH